MFDLRLVGQNHFKGIFRRKVRQQKCHKIVNYISFIALSKRIQVNSCLRKTKSKPLKNKKMCLSVKQRGHSLEPSKYTLFFYQFLSYVQGPSSQALLYNQEKGWRILSWKSNGRHPFLPYPGCDMIDCNLERRVRV